MLAHPTATPGLRRGTLLGAFSVSLSPSGLVSQWSLKDVESPVPASLLSSEQQSHVAACPQRARSAKPRSGLGHAGPGWELAALGLSRLPPAESHSHPAALPLWP